MKKIKCLILTVGIIMGFSLALVPAFAGADPPPPIDPIEASCARGASDTPICKGRNTSKFKDVVQIITNTLLFILAAVCVVVIIIAGITYTTSGGDATLVAKAKNTLLYAVVGLIVAIMAYAIVNYVISQFGA